MHILYTVCSWGLGHATRSLPIMRRLIDEGHELSIVSKDRSVELLRRELGDQVKDFVEIPDFPILSGNSPAEVMGRAMVYWPGFVKNIVDGHQQIKKLGDKSSFDLVISDGRYDGFLSDVPSFFISHQMRIMNPLRFGLMEKGSEVFNEYFFQFFSGVMIPDFGDEDNLSGDLGHNLVRIDESKLHYVGVLSDFRARRLKKEIDFLISITGPEPMRSVLEERLLSQAGELKGNIAATLGKSESIEVAQREGIKVYSFMSARQREELLNRSNMVISRSGYSTILDLAVIGSKALFLPTPGQVEQEYLGQYHNKKGTFYSVAQDEVDLCSDVEIAKKSKGIKRRCDVKASVDRVFDVIFS